MNPDALTTESDGSISVPMRVRSISVNMADKFVATVAALYLVDIRSSVSKQTLVDMRFPGDTPRVIGSSTKIPRMAVGLTSGSVVLYDTAKKFAEVKRLNAAHSQKITHLEFSRHSSKFLTSAAGGSVHLWDSLDGSFIKQIKPDNNGAVIESARFSPDEKLLIVCSVSPLKSFTVEFYDTVTGHKSYELTRECTGILTAVISPLGRCIVVGTWDGLAFWDVIDGKELGRADENRIETALGYSNDGTLLITGNIDGGIKMWNGTNGQFKAKLANMPTEITCISVAHDAGKFIAGCGTKGGQVAVFQGNVDGTRVVSDD